MRKGDVIIMWIHGNFFCLHTHWEICGETPLDGASKKRYVVKMFLM